jgi:uncharacterized repeat protein (TIGR01451 family)
LILAVAVTPAVTVRNVDLAPAISGRYVNQAIRHDVSPPLRSLRDSGTQARAPGCTQECANALAVLHADAEELLRPAPTENRAYQAATVDPVEQTSQGPRPPAPLLASFDGLGFGFTGPQGTATQGNPSDNSIAVGPNHIVEMVNTKMAVYTKKGAMFDNTGTVLYGAANNNTIFSGFVGLRCPIANSGDAVVRYDQLAQRWLYVLPVFQQPFAMCYAVSVGPDPLGPYNRYEFLRTLFPDYPRPAIWPDGYYVPTSTGDNVIEKHACVADRNAMLQGLSATEQCVILQGVSFLNNADVDGQALPPPGAPNIIMATGGAQLNGDFEDDGIYAYTFHVDWATPGNTTVTGPQKIDVAPYHFLCDGQLTSCVPQPNTTRRLDAQGDKIMQRLVYRNLGDHESIVAVHSVNTTAGGGGVRWYEFRLDNNREPYLFQQGTYAPDQYYRWMASPGMDRKGNIGIGYSFGGTPNFAGQRFAGRLADDPLGVLTLHESVLVEGESSQTGTLRWEDYTTTAMDPSDDCTFWYVGDYVRQGQTRYTTRIGSFQLPGCLTSDLGITKSDSRDPAPTGRNLTYALTVSNNGPDTASAAQVTDSLPPTVTFVSATPSQGSCNESGGTVSCSLGTIANGASAAIDIVVKPTVAGLITNTASVSSVASDPNPSNTSDSEVTSVCRITSRRSSIPCG